MRQYDASWRTVPQVADLFGIGRTMATHADGDEHYSGDHVGVEADPFVTMRRGSYHETSPDGLRPRYSTATVSTEKWAGH
ncbi:MAG TPA: hypothetical protein VF288_03990, partial [Mycobacteriales bacterium]